MRQIGSLLDLEINKLYIGILYSFSLNSSGFSQNFIFDVLQVGYMTLSVLIGKDLRWRQKRGQMSSRYI